MLLWPAQQLFDNFITATNVVHFALTHFNNVRLHTCQLVMITINEIIRQSILPREGQATDCLECAQHTDSPLHIIHTNKHNKGMHKKVFIYSERPFVFTETKAAKVSLANSEQCSCNVNRVYYRKDPLTFGIAVGHDQNELRCH